MEPRNTSSRDRAAKLLISDCTRKCTVNPANLPGDWGERIHGWYETGDSNAIMLAKLKSMGGPKLSNGSLGRHRQKHLQRMDQLIDLGIGLPTERKTDLEVLEIIIGRGAQQVDLSTTKISAEQLLRAIELKHRLTEGSVFDSLFGALVEEGDESFGEADGAREDPGVVTSEDEAAQAAPVDVG